MPNVFCSSSATRRGGGELSHPSTSLPLQGKQQSTNLPGQESKGGNIHHSCIWEPPSIRSPCPAAATHSSVQLRTAESGTEPVKGGSFGRWFHVRYISVPPRKYQIGNPTRGSLQRLAFSFSHYILYTLQQGASPMPSGLYN